MPFSGSTFTKLFNWAQDAVHHPKIRDARFDAEFSDIATGLSSLATSTSLDSDLTALANNTDNGLWARTGSGTGSARTITGTANEITATNGDGVSGNPTLSLPSSLTFTGKTVTGGSHVGATLTGSGADPSTTVDNTSTNNTLVHFSYGGAVKYALGVQSGGSQFNLYDSTLARYTIRYGLTSGDLTLQPTAGVTYVARTTTPAQPIGKMVVGDGAPIGTHGASGSEMMTVMSGSNASPVSTNTATLMVNRTESLSGGATNAYSSAIVGETVGLATSSSQANGVTGYATQYGSFDTCGIIGLGVQNGTGGAFGGYFRAIANPGTIGGFGVAFDLVNQTGNNFTYSGAFPSANEFIGLDVSYGATPAKRASAGIAMRTGGTGSEYDVGLGFIQHSTYKADIQSDTDATYILLANSGTHSYGIDLVGAGATYSTAFRSPNFRVDGSGTVSIGQQIAGNATLHVVGNVSTLGGATGNIISEDATAMAASVGGGIIFEGKYTSGGSVTPFAAIRGIKETGVSGAFTGALVGYVNDGSTGGVEAIRLKSTRVLQLPAYGTGVLQSDSSGNISSSATVTGATFSTGSNTFQINGTQVITGPDFSAALRLGVLVFKLASANMNTTADQAISIIPPTGFGAYRIQTIMFSKPSIPLTNAVGGIYTAASKGGIAVVAAGQVYSALTTNTSGASGSMLTPVVTNVNSAFYDAATLYLSLTTGQGSAATVDVTIIINPLL